jgi:hypothetical protein
VKRVGVWVLGGLIAVAMGCSSGEFVEHPEGEEAWEAARLVVASEVLAVVDGEPIPVAEVELLWEVYPEWTREEVVRAAIERAVVAREARRRGFHERPEVSFARKQGMVQALLKEEVELAATAEEGRGEELVALVQRRRRAPQGLRASHLVVLVPRMREGDDGESVRIRAEAREDLFDEALPLAEAARQWLGERSDDESLREAARWLQEEVQGGWEVAVNEHLRFPRVAEKVEPDQLPEGWTPVVREFAEAADEAAESGAVGILSEPVRTEFGWHLIRVDEVLPERLVEPEALAEFVADQEVLEARVRKLSPAIQRWVAAAQVELYPERLERAGVEGY